MTFDDYPDPNQHLPTEKLVTNSPAAEPNEVLLTFNNETGKNLSLLLYDCTAHYQPNSDSGKFVTRWIQIPFPADGSEHFYDKFVGGSGWYVVYIMDAAKNAHYLETVNFFEGTHPNLIVTKDAGNEADYEMSLIFKEGG